MTKETKIGLLVGLAFIIVVGILLSDHVANSSRPPEAVLSNVGNNVRDSVAIPQSAATPVVLAAPAGPTTPVPTREELQQRPAASNVVVGIGPGKGVQSITPAPVVAEAIRSSNGQTTMPLEASDQPTSVSQNAVNPPAAPADASITPISLNDGQSSSTALKHYVVQRGDTLGKLAHQFYGTSSHAAIEAILKANPEMKGDPTHLAMGRTYVIPAFGNSAGSPAAKADSSTSHVAVPAHSRAIASTYTVKSGDTLWKIASEQLGSGTDWKTIEQLNRNIVKGGTLKVGTVLKLPARTVASVD